MGHITAIQRRVEYGRYFAPAHITEVGIYAEDEVPEDYSGSFIAEIEVCFVLVSVDATGKLLLTTYNPPELLDKANAEGNKIVDPDGRTVREADGGSATIQLQWRLNPHMPDVMATHGAVMWEVAQRELGEWYV